MKIYEAISSRIMNLCYKRDITLYELSKISGIPKTTLKDIVSMKSQNTRIENVEKIAAAFNLSIRDFFDNDVFESMKSSSKADCKSLLYLKIIIIY